MTLATGTRKSPRLAQARILNKHCGAWPCAHAECMYWPAAGLPLLNRPPSNPYRTRVPIPIARGPPPLPPSCSKGGGGTAGGEGGRMEAGRERGEGGGAGDVDLA